eukprot:SAG11_NODE_8515_length_1007_cov_1.235683_2_plen_83_part_01
MQNREQKPQGTENNSIEHRIAWSSTSVIEAGCGPIAMAAGDGSAESLMSMISERSAPLEVLKTTEELFRDSDADNSGSLDKVC